MDDEILVSYRKDGTYVWQPTRGFVKLEDGDSFDVPGGNFVQVNNERSATAELRGGGWTLLVVAIVLIVSGASYLYFHNNDDCDHVLARAGTPDTQWEQCQQ